MDTIQIFIASSAELKQDRDDFREFLSVLNDRGHEKGIYLKLIEWEHFLDTVSQTGKQDDYNEALKKSQIVICLFYTKAGKYTQLEFDTALHQFKETGSPLIYTYFKSGAPEPDPNDVQALDLAKFKKRLGDLKHFYTVYNNIDDLKNQFRKQLDRLEDRGFIAMQKEIENETKDSLANYFNSVVENIKYDNGIVSSSGAEETGSQHAEKIDNIGSGTYANGSVSSSGHNETGSQHAEKITNIGSVTFNGGGNENAKRLEKQFDEVNCTLYAPQEVMSGNQFLVQVFAHTDEQLESIEKLAHLADDTSTHRGTSQLPEVIERGTKIDFNLIFPGLIVDEPTLSVNWKGKIVFVQFGVKVPNDFPTSDLIGTVIIAKNSIPIGQIKFKIKILSVKSNQGALQTENSSSKMKKFQQAFISYASQDRKDVLKRVQMLSLIDLKFFQDLLTLEPGQIWEKELYNYIDACDVFFLFWSKAASQAEWVMKEVRYAIKRKANNWDSPPEIIPVIIEGPSLVKPPEELNFLHFNDRFVYFINSDFTNDPGKIDTGINFEINF